MTPFPTGHTGEAARYRRSGAWDGRLLDGHVDAAPPDRVAVVDGSARLTYREQRDRVARAAAGLRRLGVGRGDVVSSQLPNWWEALVLHLAVIRIGAVGNPLMPILREREMRFALANAGSSVLVVASEFRGYDHAAPARRLQPELPALRHVVTVRPGFEELLGDPAGGEADPDRTPGDPVAKEGGGPPLRPPGHRRRRRGGGARPAGKVQKFRLRELAAGGV